MSCELKSELLRREEASELFGQERAEHLQGIQGSIDQTFDGEDLYPSVEEKAAHLFYFVIKDHPFADGNKRIGAFVFLEHKSFRQFLYLPLSDWVFSIAPYRW